MEFTEKKVLVFGTGISGVAAANLLENAGAEVVLFDGNEKPVSYTHLTLPTRG